MSRPDSPVSRSTSIAASIQCGIGRKFHPSYFLPLSHLLLHITDFEFVSYSGTDISANMVSQANCSIADVFRGTNLVQAFDTFLGASPGGSQTYEVMVWLGVYGNISPLSSNGYPPTPIATPTIDGVPFNLILGMNDDVTVYSFVAASRMETTWSGDLMAFYQYLESQNEIFFFIYLVSIEFLSVLFVGSDCVMTTSAYSITID